MSDKLQPIDGGAHGSAAPLSLLNRNLGVAPIVFMVVAAAAPLAIVAANLPVLIAQSRDAGAPVYFLICTVLLTIFSVGFTLMSRHVPNAGAFYSYIQAGLGRVVGTGSAAVALVSYLLLMIGVTAYFGVVATSLIATWTGAEIPWWVLSFTVLAIVAFLGYRDIELSSKVLIVALSLEALIVVVMNIAVLINTGATARSFAIPLDTIAVGVPALGVMFAFYSFIGFEATAVFRNEARDPDRTIPRATYIAVIAIGLFSAISAYCVVIGVGTDRIVEAATNDPANMVLQLMASTAGLVVESIAQVLLVTSFLACVLSFHNIVTRYAFTLGRKRIFPESLGTVSTKHRAPSRASLVVSVVGTIFILGTVIAGLDPVAIVFTLAGAASSLGVVILMTLVSIAMLVFFRRVNTGKSVWHTLIAPLISTIGLGTILVLVIANFTLLAGTPAQTVGVMAFVFLAFVAGAIAALVMRSRRPKLYDELLDVKETTTTEEPAHS